MSEIDWNVELRKIEREYDGLPPEPSANALRARRAAELRERQEAAERIALVGGWARLVLVTTLAVALYWWPHARGCGLDLAAFLGAEAMVAVGGLWVAVFTWRHRLATGHTLALVLLIAGLARVAVQTLPRLGYATFAGVPADGWLCAAGSARGAGVTPPATP